MGRHGGDLPCRGADEALQPGRHGVNRIAAPRQRVDKRSSKCEVSYLLWRARRYGICVDLMRETKGNLSTARLDPTFGAKPGLVRKALDRYAKTLGKSVAPTV
jgi:hypothetical protein